MDYKIERLKESEEKFRTLAEQAIIGIIIMQDGVYKYINERLAEMMGYSVEEMLKGGPQGFIKILHPDDVSIITQIFKERERGLQEGTNHYQFRGVKKTGELIWGELHSKTITYEGRPADFITILDITENKKNEKNLKLLSSAVEQASESIALVNLDGNLFFSNSAFAKAHGYEAEEIIGENLSIFHTEEQMELVDRANRIIKEKGEFSGEVWHKHKDGSTFPTLMHNSLLKDQNEKEIGMIGTFVNLSEKKEAEQKILESEQKYKDLSNQLQVILDNLPAAVFSYDTDGRFIQVNKFLADAFNTTKENMTSKITYDFFPKSQANKLKERDLEIIRNKRSIEYIDSLETPDGMRWGLNTKIPLLDKKGNIHSILGISTDITEIKKAEKELKESEERYRSLIKETTDAIFCYECEPPIPIDLPIEEQIKLLYNCRLMECNLICAKSYMDTTNWKKLLVVN